MPTGLAAVVLGETQPEGVWNTQTLAFEPSPPSRMIDPLVFMRRFSLQEEAAIRVASRTDAHG